MFLERDQCRKEGAINASLQGKSKVALQGASKAESQSISEESKVLNLTLFGGQSWLAIPHKY